MRCAKCIHDHFVNLPHQQRIEGIPRANVVCNSAVWNRVDREENLDVFSLKEKHKKGRERTVLR